MLEMSNLCFKCPTRVVLLLIHSSRTLVIAVRICRATVSRSRQCNVILWFELISRQPYLFMGVRRIIRPTITIAVKDIVDFALLLDEMLLVDLLDSFNKTHTPPPETPQEVVGIFLVVV